MTKPIELSEEEWDALETLAEEGETVDDKRLLARLEARGMVLRVEGRAELTPDARLRLASHRLTDR